MNEAMERMKKNKKLYFFQLFDPRKKRIEFCCFIFKLNMYHKKKSEIKCSDKKKIEVN